MAAKKDIRAWVVRWEWSGPHAAVQQPVAAVWRPQRGGAELRLVEALYASREYSPTDMLESIRPNGHRPYQASWGTIEIEIGGQRRHVPWGGEIVCGHNPFLVARKAWVWAAPDGSGQIEWEDDPRLVHSTIGSQSDDDTPAIPPP